MDVLVNGLLLLGLATVAVGLGLMWLPVGVVAAGLELLLIALLLARWADQAHTGAAREADESGKRTVEE